MSSSSPSPPPSPPPSPGISPRELHRRLRAGHELLLVCAYPGDVGRHKFPLPEALKLEDLEARAAALDPEDELVFYCRCPGDKTSTDVARAWRERGFEQVRVLTGGHRAWVEAGLSTTRL